MGAELLEKLARFGLLCLEESRDELADLDGGWLQDTAVSCGILVPVEVNAPCHESECRCAEYGDFPQACFRYANGIDVLQAKFDSHSSCASGGPT